MSTSEDSYEASFEALFRVAYRSAYAITNNREDAEDAAIEALAAAYTSWERIRDRAAPWIIRVATNKAIDAWRRQRKRDNWTDFEEVDQTASAEDRLIVLSAVASLSKRQREVLVLRYVLGLTESETAIALGCSIGAVKKHSNRGLRALRVAVGGA